MNRAVVINTLEELQAFLNDNGVLEIALRNKNKRFKAFQKALINIVPETEGEELAQKVIQAINKSTKLSEQGLKILGSVSQLGEMNLLLNGLNLCATCVGFAIMYAKLNSMSGEINQQFARMQQTVKDIHDVQTGFEFDKVLADHTDMLDSQKRQQPYSEGKMRKLVDREYNVLMLLVQTFQKDVSGDCGALIFSIFSMLAMLTASLRIFDETYYFNNKEVLGDSDPWHLSHDKWLSAYDSLSSEWFIEKLQDYATFKTNLTTPEVDVYYISLIDQVSDLREEVVDNQALIIALSDADLFRQYKKMSSEEIAKSIETAFYEAGSGLEESVVSKAYQSAMQQAALA